MKNIDKTRRPILLSVVVLLLMMGSCAKDRPVGMDQGNGETEVEMTFKAPRNSTRAAIAAEDGLKDVTLLVFEGSGATSKFLYSRYAWRTSDTENKFKTTLQIGNGLAIYFVANAKDLVKKLEDDGKLVESVTTWATAKELLILDTPTGFNVAAKGLPMWGHKFNVEIADAPQNSLGKVNLLRSVASTDVSVLATNFTLEKGHLVFAADKGYLAYDPSLLSDGQVTQPQSPSGMATSVDWAVTATGNEVSNYFYMYDNATSLTPAGTNRPTKVILEGEWTGTGGSGKTTFYPLTFRDYNSTTKEYDKKQVTRNNKYLIVVTGVYGDGWGSLDEAKDADDVNMEYDVIEWDQNKDGEIIIDGPKYFYRSAGSVALGHKQNSSDFPNQEEVVIRTNYKLSDIKMTFTSDGTPVTGSVSNSRFKAEVVQADPDGTPDSGDEYTCFRFTALKDYADDAENPSVLYVTVGRMSFDIAVSQLPRDPGKWEDGGNDNMDL